MPTPLEPELTAKTTPAAPPEISVVIPHLNGAEGLALCLSSLAAQENAPRFDVIVVDNGSKDLPEAVLAPYPFARLIQEPTPGPGPARSTGARAAAAPLLAFLDADCRADPGWLASIAAAFRKDPALAVVGGDIRIAFDDPHDPTAVESYEAVYGYRMALYVARDGYTATCNMAVRAEVFAAVGDFAGIGIAEDVDWGRRATRAGHKIAYDPSMGITTPARPDFAALARKWDRHIGHDAADLDNTSKRVRFAMKACALVGSPILEVPKILRSDRLPSALARRRALACLTRIRLYRARKMIAQLLGAARTQGDWSRS